VLKCFYIMSTGINLYNTDSMGLGDIHR